MTTTLIEKTSDNKVLHGVISSINDIWKEHGCPTMKESSCTTDSKGFDLLESENDYLDKDATEKYNQHIINLASELDIHYIGSNLWVTYVNRGEKWDGFVFEAYEALQKFIEEEYSCAFLNELI